MSRLLILIMCFVMFIGAADAGTIYVSASLGNDSWPGTWANPKQSISAGISAAVDGDEVVVRPGTYTGANNRNLNTSSKNIIVRSDSGNWDTIIDAEGVDRAIKTQGAPAGAKIKGFTIQNGYTSTTLTYGGGGGGVYLSQAAITIEDCVIRDCTGPEGAGMLIRNSTGTRIVNCMFINNTAEYVSMSTKAAGVSLFLNYDVEFSGCQFISNRVLASGYNGGVMSIYRYEATFRNCLFEGNYAYRSGGVAFVEEGMLTFDKCTFYGNSSGGNGGCFWIGYMGADHDVECTNCIFFGNSAGGNGDVAFLNGVGVAGGRFRYGYSNIHASQIYSGGTGGTTVQNLGGNIYVDPMFVFEGYWDSQVGGWIGGDYHLKSMVGRYNRITGGWTVEAAHSECIDAGDPAEDYSGEPSPNGERINIGAYAGTSQASKSPFCKPSIAADLNRDCRVDFADFAMFAMEWLTCDYVPHEFCW